MSTKVNVDVDLSGVLPKVENMTKLGQYALVNQVHADMNIYVPALDYDLRNQSSIGVDGKSVNYNVPYARRQFYVPAINYTTPGTGARWDLKAKGIHRLSWENIVKRAMK